jgi:hypothetical protein
MIMPDIMVSNVRRCFKDVACFAPERVFVAKKKSIVHVFINRSPSMLKDQAFSVVIRCVYIMLSCYMEYHYFEDISEEDFKECCNSYLSEVP